MNKLIVVLLMLPMVVMGQDAPFECDNNFGECGTPEMSGGGGNAGGGSILINNSDLGDTYQTADDYDDDGVEDSYDNCPRTRNNEQFDTDGDGVGDLCDNCRDTHNINQWNLDGDTLGDLCDSDMDGDNVLNDVDNCLRRHNTGQSDLDENGEGDACDDDLDGDGIINIHDECPTMPGEIVDAPDRASECFPDRDGDGVSDFGINADNCLGVYNPEQSNIDNDANGDACDPDIDNDTVLNERDNCKHVFNVNQADIDRDGRGDVGCDDHYCYVVYGDESNCLDPEAGFRVYSPNVSLTTSETVNLRLFMNRENQAARYTWAVISRPKKSKVTIINPLGSVAESSLFEYIHSQRPTFSPDQPGTYILALNVNTVFDVENSESHVTSQHEITLQVSSHGREDNYGCNASPGSRNNGASVLLVAFLLGFMQRRLALKASHVSKPY